MYSELSIATLNKKDNYVKSLGRNWLQEVDHYSTIDNDDINVWCIMSNMCGAPLKAFHEIRFCSQSELAKLR